MNAQSIIKRRGRTEHYDERKLYGSVYAAALTALHKESAAERIAAQVCASIATWMPHQKKITSELLRNHVHELLKQIDKETAFLYFTHLDIN